MHFRYFVLLAVLSSLAGVGCGGKIEATAFLDGNADSLPNSTEQTLSNLNLKITRNGKLLTTGNTNSRGKFAYSIQESGYYCVEVNEAHLNESVMRQLNYGRIPPGAVSTAMSNVSIGPPVGMAGKQVVTPPTTPVPSSPSSPAQPAPATPATSSEDEEDPLPSPSQPDRTEPGIVCKNSTDFNLALHIPVAIDYSADVARMPAHIKQERRTGEEFAVAIPVSIGCLLEPLYVPDGLSPFWPLEPTEIEKFFNIDRTSGRVEFRPARQSTSVSLPLKVKEDLPLGTYSVTIAPFMLCPGDQRIALPAIPIDLIAKPFVEVFQELPSGEQVAGGTIPWKIFVKNEGSRAYEVTVSGNAAGPVSSLAPEATECRTMGSTRVECDFDLAPDEIKELNITTRFLDIDYQDITTFNASATVEGSDDSLTAEPADVRIAPVAP